MTKVKIVTDSNSGITQAEAEKLGISVIPMPFLIGGEQFFEDLTLTQAEFYKRLKSGADVSTSQPSVSSVTELWDSLLSRENAEIVHIPMSSGLSQSCQTAIGLAKEYGRRVEVVDNQRISISQKQSVYDAIALRDRGFSAAEIKDILIKTKFDSSIYISLDTLKYLKKGGRLTPAAALIGSILKIKPVLQIQGEKLDAYKKVNTLRKAKEVMIGAIRYDLETRFADLCKNGEMSIGVAHTDNEEEALRFHKELSEIFPGIPVTFCDPLSLSVSCHIGPGALAAACMRVIKNGPYMEREGE